MKLNILLVYSVIIIVFSNCCKKPINNLRWPAIDDSEKYLMPYLYYDKSFGHDTTFEYKFNLSNKPIELPINIFGSIINGAADIFVTLDSLKQILDIEIYEYKIFCDEKVWKSFIYQKYSFNDKNDLLMKFLKGYLKPDYFLRKKSNFDNKNLHKTYCYISFYTTKQKRVVK